MWPGFCAINSTISEFFLLIYQQWRTINMARDFSLFACAI